MATYHQKFPQGRVGTTQFCEITGLGRTTFLMKYRPDPYYIELFDLRIDAHNRLNMSEKAARAFARTRIGKRPHGNTGRFHGVPCPHCAASIAPNARKCRACGGAICKGQPGGEDPANHLATTS
jgi:hypothetical protein